MSENTPSKIPANAPQPQDHKKKASAAARKAEAKDGFVTIEQCGVELRIPIGGKIPLRAAEAFNNNDRINGSRHLLGDEQWNALLDAGADLDDFSAIGRKIEEAAGN